MSADIPSMHMGNYSQTGLDQVYTVRELGATVAQLTHQIDFQAETIGQLQARLNAAETENGKLIHSNFMLSHDSLTGLPDRSMFYNWLNEATQDARKVGRFAVLFVDLDGLKKANDDSPDGHSAGDALILKAAIGIRSTANLFTQESTPTTPLPSGSRHITEPNVVARLQGDEFGVILWNIDDEEKAVELATRIKTRLREAPRKDRVMLSVGAALHDPDEIASDVLKRADQNMRLDKIVNTPDLTEDKKEIVLGLLKTLATIEVSDRDLGKYAEKYRSELEADD